MPAARHVCGEVTSPPSTQRTGNVVLGAGGVGGSGKVTGRVCEAAEVTLLSQLQVVLPVDKQPGWDLGDAALAINTPRQAGGACGTCC